MRSFLSSMRNLFHKISAGDYMAQKLHLIWTAACLVLIVFLLYHFYPTDADGKEGFIKSEIEKKLSRKGGLELLKKLTTGRSIEMPENFGLSYYTISPNANLQNLEGGDDGYYGYAYDLGYGRKSVIVTDSNVYFFDRTWKPFPNSEKNFKLGQVIGKTAYEVFTLSKIGDAPIIRAFSDDGDYRDIHIDQEFSSDDASPVIFASPLSGGLADEYLYDENADDDSLDVYSLNRKTVIHIHDTAQRTPTVIDFRLFFRNRWRSPVTTITPDYENAPLKIKKEPKVNSPKATAADFMYLDMRSQKWKPIFAAQKDTFFNKNFDLNTVRMVGTGNGIQLIVYDKKQSKCYSIEKEYGNGAVIQNEISINLDTIINSSRRPSYYFIAKDIFAIKYLNDYTTTTPAVLFQKTKDGAKLLYDASKSDPMYERKEFFFNADTMFFILKNAGGDFRLREIVNGQSVAYPLPTGYTYFYFAPTTNGVNIIGTIGNNLAYAVITQNHETGKFNEQILDTHIYWKYNPFSVVYNYNPVSIVLVGGFAVLLFLLVYFPLYEHSKREDKPVNLISYEYLPSLKEKFLDIQAVVRKLQLNSRLMFFCGIGLAIMGITIFVIMVTEDISTITESNDSFDWKHVVEIGRTTVLFGFIETVSFFLLRQYRVLFNEYKDFYALYLNIQRIFHILDMSPKKEEPVGSSKYVLTPTTDELKEIRKILLAEKFSFSEVHTDNSVIDAEFVKVLEQLNKTMDSIKSKIPG